MDNLVLGRRLRAYRLSAGWSLRELSERVGSRVTPQALSQYETGRTHPRTEVLHALAWALGTHVDQLGREPDAVRLGAIQFRHPFPATHLTTSRARGWLTTLAEQSLALEQRLGGSLVSLSLPQFDELKCIDDSEDAEELAQDVRRRWGLGTGPLPHLVSLFEARGIRVFETPQADDSQDFNGCSAFLSYSAVSGADFPGGVAQSESLGRAEAFHALPRTRPSDSSECNALLATTGCSGTYRELVRRCSSPSGCAVARPAWTEAPGPFMVRTCRDQEAVRSELPGHYLSLP